jgi:hypothetical protein
MSKIKFILGAALLVLAVSNLAPTAAEAEMGQSLSYCTASTQCGYYARDYYGRPYFVPTHTISCNAWAAANTGTACTWNWQFNNFVQCTGLDGYGRWSNFFFTCR